MKLHFRRAEANDLAFLLTLEQESFPPFQQNSKQAIKHAISSSFQDVFIAEQTNPSKVRVGAIVLFKYKRKLRLYSIGLLPSFQKRGYGQLMLNYVKEYALRNDFESIILEASKSNPTLIDWYLSAGFVTEEEIIDYYCLGESAIKMSFKVNIIPRHKETQNIIVINQPFKWNNTAVNAQIISVKEYISNPIFQHNSNYRIFNMCTSYKYQSYGYYVSLLASARGQRVIPSITTIRDFRLRNVIQSAAYDIDELINRLLSKHAENTFSLNIYFGQTPTKGYKALAMKLYKLFEAPLFNIDFVKHDKWFVKNINVLTLKNIPEGEKSLMYEFATNYFNRKRYNHPKLTNYKYDLAVLINPCEENPPSNELALQKLKKAANKKGVYVEFITKSDIDKINEFDALFIRETTNVNHHTYEMSRLAYAEGLIVIDDPWSILRCTNKIYQSELFIKHKIKAPQTIALTKNIKHSSLLNTLNYPVVLKQPDSAFSLGVIKVNNKEEAQHELTRLFKISDMVVCQEFMYSEFDWRIGILDNTPLFACNYYMSKDHWQIYDWNSTIEEKEGNSETLSIEDVPQEILQTAIKAASLIGDGLYGVDLKMVNGTVYVVEVNDNPNIDNGIEDLYLGDALYDKLIDSFVNRIEIAKNISKINFNSH